ncbi:hypothetical protein GCM10023153_04940 [Ornithinibacter aureus]|uniref:Phosphoesterase PA-phosphatase n=1 Tax=Ornithinibacter aureus TaxID=622664 RepID=A0ABP8JDK7_9MICO|nr:hypothetical protein [Ornithinibacter aureus]KAF0833971.1 hypothetical protein C8E84_1778 [Ornithinibacter aureus]
MSFGVGRSDDAHDVARLEAASQDPSVVARWVAGVFTPANVVLAVMAYVAVRHSDSVVEAALWWAVTLLLVVALPYAILFRAMRGGRVDDRQVVRRSQRPWLYVMALACVAAALALLVLAGAPLQVVALVVAMGAGLAAMLLATLVAKASMHLAVAAGAVAVVVVEQPLVGAVLSLVLVPIAWARHRDGRHSVGQLVAGALIGGVTAFVVYALLT